MFKPVALALLLVPLFTQAHTFLIKPDNATANPDEPLQFSVLMTEKLFQGERLLDPEQVEVHLLQNGKTTPLNLEADETAKALRGEAAAPTGDALLVARAAPRYRPIDKKEKTDDPAKMLRIENFSKALINPATDGVAYHARSGDRLELIALDNPASLSASKPMRVQVLFEGEPLPGKVQALSPGRERIVAETDAEGIASLTLPTAGVWIVRSSHHREEADARSARYEASANLVFAID
ncbi:DUF4198 domain-containing protein [Stutzerimonas stutzeri]|uniref:DUF4198 domain-containing protein n=1 Tax=Stutzerimonas stutzeri KOS6 TaxID=1218352 RepID=A0A061JQ56_STUST|nr:DUF4198 domain-containing protein [Stutzerimonas stutzeri]EWC40480.1 hypothetical protein B597_015160 [Stutzerimonas stutzeri KOS6]